MCGIFGIVNFHEQLKNEDLITLSEKMFHRGPDDYGLFKDKNLGLGMRRLSIIDLIGGHQPMYNHDKSICLVFNGEIYNYRELRITLINKGYNFQSESDVEVLIYLYEEYGIDCIDMVNGMFAFALYDKNKNILWLARDRLGIKPLYYSVNDSMLSFSSELSGLAKLNKAAISRKSIISYLGMSYVQAPNSIYKEIKKLMPGEQILFNTTSYKFTKNKYWEIGNINKRNININSSIEELNFLISDSVKKQLISDVPLGIFLSGGIDSSTIATYASKISKNINTFTINFEDKLSSDSKYANFLSKSINSNHNEIKTTSFDQIDAINELIMLMDEPMSDSAIVPTYLVSKSASQKGMKVMLSGAGADEIFGGYERHFPNKLGSTAWLANRSDLIKSILLPLLAIKNNSYSYRFKNIARNFNSNISGVNYSFLKESFFDNDDFDNLLEIIDETFEVPNKKDNYQFMLMDVDNYLHNNILMLTDQATMAVSVEGRVPFLDHRIVEFAFSIRKEINLLKNSSKGLLKKTLRDILPIQILNRKKEGFNAPIHNWIQNWPKIVEDELINNTSPHLNELIDISKVQIAIRDKKLRHLSANSLYALYVLNIWMRKKKY